MSEGGCSTPLHFGNVGFRTDDAHPNAAFVAALEPAQSLSEGWGFSLSYGTDHTSVILSKRERKRARRRRIPIRSRATSRRLTRLPGHHEGGRGVLGFCRQRRKSKPTLARSRTQALFQHKRIYAVRVITWRGPDHAIAVPLVERESRDIIHRRFQFHGGTFETNQTILRRTQ